MAAHYIELIPTALTQLGQGVVLYNSPTTTAGGDTAINFEQLHLAAEGDTFAQIPLAGIPPGEYHYLRVSLA